MTRREKILQIVNSDSAFEIRRWRGIETWVGTCIHCNRRLIVSLAGDAEGSASAEHILPRNYGGADEPRNMVLACARCNHQKIYRTDILTRDDPKAQRVIKELQAQRDERWRDS